LRAARQRKNIEASKKTYKKRAGVEGRIPQATHSLHWHGKSPSSASADGCRHEPAAYVADSGSPLPVSEVEDEPISANDETQIKGSFIA
jgi:hypothetical protein